MNVGSIFAAAAFLFPAQSFGQSVSTIQFKGFVATCQNLTTPEDEKLRHAYGSCTTPLFSIEYRIREAPAWFSYGQEKVSLFLRLIADRETAAIQEMVPDIEMPAALPWQRDAPPRPIVLPTKDTGFCAVGLVEPPKAFPKITLEDNLNPMAVRCFVDWAGLMFTIDFFPSAEIPSVDESLLLAAAMSTTIDISN